MSFLKKYVNVTIIIFTCILGQIMSSLLCDHKDVYAYKEKVRFFIVFFYFCWSLGERLQTNSLNIKLLFSNIWVPYVLTYILEMIILASTVKIELLWK